MNVLPIVSTAPPAGEFAASAPGEMPASSHVADTSDAFVSSELLQSLPANLGQAVDLSA